MSASMSASSSPVSGNQQTTGPVTFGSVEINQGSAAANPEWMWIALAALAAAGLYFFTRGH